MATVFKSVRASDVIIAPVSGVNSITTRSGFLELKSAASNDVRLAYDLPSNDRSVATKVYVDSVSQGLVVKEAVRAKTSAALGATVTYAAGTSPASMTVTSTSNGTIASALASFDNVALALNDRVLYASESGSNQKYHGLYYVLDAGSAGTPWVLKRTVDADNITITSEVKSGIFTFVTEGDVYVGSGWVLTTQNPITLDTTLLVFTQFSGSGAITLANVGTGQGIYASTSGSTLNLRSLAATVGANSSTALEVATASNTITYNFDSSKITTTGALTSGSINWSGDIKTTGNITASGSNVSAVNVTASGILTGSSLSIGSGATITYTSTSSGANKLIVPNSTGDALSITNAADTLKYLTVNSSAGTIILPQSKLDLSTAAGTVTLLGNSSTALSFNGGSNILTLDTTTGSNKVVIPQGVIKFGSSTAALEIDGNSASAFAIRNTAATKDYLSVRSSDDTVLLPQGKVELSASTTFTISSNNINSFKLVDGSNSKEYLSLDTANSRVILTNTYFSGSIIRSSLIVGADTTLDTTHDLVSVNATSGAKVITLPAAVSGRILKITKQDSSSNTVTIVIASGNSINGVVDDTIVLYSQQESVSLICTENFKWVIC